jgi:hypothetical protein
MQKEAIMDQYCLGIFLERLRKTTESSVKKAGLRT